MMRANSIPSSPELGTPRRACSSLTETGSKVSTVRMLSVRELETKNAKLQRKVSCVEEENACLQLENRQLISEMEAVQLELANYKTKVTVLGSAVESKSSSVTLMKEQIEAMENEIEAQRIELRDWEKKHEEVHEILVMKSRIVEDLTEDLRASQAHFEDLNSRSQKIEQQRNEALSNAKKQTQAFQAYKADMTQKLKKLSENEDLLKHSLIQCDSEKGEVERRNSLLEQEKAEMHKLISQLKEAAETSDILKSECDSHRSQLKEAVRRSDDLSHRLEVKESELGEMEALRREAADLRLLTTSLQQRLEQNQQEAQLSRNQLSNLEAILDLLHLRESGGVALCVSPCLLPPVPADDVPNLQPGEQYQRLLPVLRLLEQERARQTHLTRGLQERLAKTQEEASALQTGITQREHHLQQLQSQLQQRFSELTQLEGELKKKNIRLAATEKQLEEKTSAMSLALEHSSELEYNLVEKSSSIQLLRSALDTGKKDYQTALEEAQRLHADQRKTLEDQIKMLQLSVEQKGAQMVEMERTLLSTQQERQEALQRAAKLQTSLSRVSLETEANSQREQEALRSLGEHAAQYSSRVKALETALSSCQEELSRCLQQMEKAKSHFEEQLDTKSREMEFLQAELERISRALESSSHQSQQLQHAAQQQETMLKESSTLLMHMEANHTALLKQVEELQRELEKERALAAEELRKREQEMQQANEQAEIRGREAAQLSSSVMQLTTDMSKYRGELSEREKELLLIRRASGAQASQLAHMEKMLTQTKGLLEKKTEIVQDLEEKVQRSKRDRRNSLHRTQLLETQMKTVRGELVDTLDHLQELRNVLRRSQQQAEERKAAMEKLATELREAQQELEQRNEQVKDKDVALKDKQHELQQKALQLSQLESAVQEHRTAMEQKLLHLQQATERSERELSDRNKQVAFLSEHLELVQAQLQGETLEEEALLQTQQLRECREQLQRTAQSLQEMHSRCESLTGQLEESSILGQERESQVRLLEEELNRMAEQASHTERRLQEAVATLTLELETMRKQHQAELAALQESQAEMMKASECVSSTLRSSQELLIQDLQHTRTQLDEAQRNAAALLAELRSREHFLHNTSEALLLKESEITRLKTKISSLERGAELRSLSQSVGLPLPSLTSAITSSPPPQWRGERRTLSPSTKPHAVDGDDSAGDLPIGARDTPQSPGRLAELKADQTTTLRCPRENSLRKSLFIGHGKDPRENIMEEPQLASELVFKSIHQPFKP